ncbi:MAG: TetR/AcrR family transcriptional regulator [Bacteroidetes bacterium]|nr:TetR/AcrR family transcriptional regulator [Bacteroidota bacterium]
MADLPVHIGTSQRQDTQKGGQSGTRAVILSVAARLFGEVGYHGAGMRQLADLVGIEPASVYSHFRSKGEILQVLAWQCADDFAATLRPVYESELNTRSKLQRMIELHVEVLIRNLEQAPVFNREWQHLEPEAKAEYARLRDNYEGMYRAVIRQGIAQHLFKPMDEKFAALTLLSALNFMPQWYRPEGEKSPQELGEILASMLLQGLLKSF